MREYVVFDIPMRLLPDKIHHWPEHSVYAFPSKAHCEIMAQFPDSIAMGILIHDVAGRLAVESFQEKLRDILTVISASSPQIDAFQWLSWHWLDIRKADKTAIAEGDLDAAVRALSLAEKPRRNAVQEVVDFDSCRPFAICQTRHSFSLQVAISKYLSLHPDDRLKHQLETLAFARCAPGFLNRIYPNGNLGPSLLWTVLESLLPRADSKLKMPCPGCGELVTTQSDSPTTRERVQSFISGLGLSEQERDMISLFLAKLQRNIRNPFYHAARKPDHDYGEQFVKKLGRNSFSFLEEIQFNDGRHTGVHMLEAILTDELMAKLGAVS